MYLCRTNLYLSYIPLGSVFKFIVAEGIEKNSYLFSMVIGIQLLHSLKEFIESTSDETDSPETYFATIKFATIIDSEALCFWVAHTVDSICESLYNCEATKGFGVQVHDISCEIQQRKLSSENKSPATEKTSCSTDSSLGNSTPAQDEIEEDVNLCIEECTAVEWYKGIFNIDAATRNSNMSKHSIKQAFNRMVYRLKDSRAIDW